MDHSIFPRFMVFLMVFVGIGLVSWEPKALAADAKFYPGTTCIRISGPGNLLYDLDGSIKNNDTRGTIKVNCPIIRDMTEEDRGLNHISYESNSLNLNNLGTCYLRAIQPTRYGSGYKTVKQDETKRYSKLTLRSNFPEGVMYMFSCDIPPGQRLIGYYAYETEH